MQLGRSKQLKHKPKTQGKTQIPHFFSSRLADVALRLGPYMSISSQKDILYKDPGGPSKLANPNKPEKHKTNTHDDPQIPQPDLRFRQEKNSKPDKKTGQGPNKKTTHNKDLPKDTADLPLCHSTKACKMNYPPRHSVKHEDRSKNEWLRYQEWKTVH